MGIINKGLLYLNFCILLCLGCTYKAGNRQQDLSFSIKSSVNSFYVEKYLYENYRVKDESNYPMNAELRNYSNSFFFLPDSVHHYGYVIEDHVILDSTIVQSRGLLLSSIYDYKKAKWLYARDSINSEIIRHFKSYFESTVLLQTVQTYRDSINHDALFTTSGKEIEIIEIY